MSLRKAKQHVRCFDIATQLEKMKHKGWAISLINDDGGQWAFVADGFQNCRTKREGLSSSWWVDSSEFRPTIAQAWSHFKKVNLDA